MKDRAPSAGEEQRVEGEAELVTRPTPHSSAVTPSGIEIEYFFKPRRYYEIRQLEQCRDCLVSDGINNVSREDRSYCTDCLNDVSGDWLEVPSVSTVVDLLKDSGPLTWWGMRVGIEGTLQAWREGQVYPASTLKQIESWVKAHDLDTNKVKKLAGDRGQVAHDALELWAQDGTIPDPKDFGPEERGYIAGLKMFLEHLEVAEPEIVASERMVASLEHEVAGRYDIEIRTHKPAPIIKRWTPKRGPQWATLQPSLIVPDLKTSAFVYDEHVVQLEGYEMCRIESGYEPSDARGVIHVHPGDPDSAKQPDGPYYEFVPSKKPEAARGAFIAARGLYEALRAL